MDERDDEVPLKHPLIGIVYNLKKADHTQTDAPDMEAEYDSMDTVLAIQRALEQKQVHTALYEADDHLPERLQSCRPDMVFNIAEGRGGRAREAQVPALLSMLGIPHTGSDETALCVALDKGLTKRLLGTYHIRTPRYAVVSPLEPLRLSGLTYPVIVKPNAEGSSKGIGEVSVAASAQELRGLITRAFALYGESMLVEEFLPGREFTVGILGNGAETRVFAPMEIVYNADAAQGEYHVYSYPVKQDFKRFVHYECPARLTNEETKEMTRMARKAYDALGCVDFARADFRMDAAGKIHFIEINPLPGLAPGYSDYPMLAEACGVSYDELVYGVLAAAAKRCGLRL